MKKIEALVALCKDYREVVGHAPFKVYLKPALLEQWHGTKQLDEIRKFTILVPKEMAADFWIMNPDDLMEIAWLRGTFDYFKWTKSRVGFFEEEGYVA